MSKPRILIVDDDKSVVETLSYILEKNEFSVSTSQDGVSALEKVRYGDFNIAILDYKMPDMNGVVLAREIKRENKNIEVIILTGKATLESAIKAVKEDVFDYLIKPVNPEELIKAMQGALEKQRLVRKNQELIWELRKKNKELERVNKFKSGLISMISHDLSSPISSLKGFNESFLKGFLGELTPKQRKVIETENKAIDTMMDLINGLLDMQQIEAGKLKMNKKPCSIVKDVIEPLLERFSVHAREKNIDLRLKCDKSIPKVNIDPSKISQVVQNILQNAIKFTPDEGWVEVRVKDVDEKNIEVNVQDSGRGIPPHELNSIFEVFYTKNDMEFSPAGRGLGLSICKEIIKAHNGMIWAESSGLNQGSTFIFVLPKNGE